VQVELDGNSQRLLVDTRHSVVSLALEDTGIERCGLESWEHLLVHNLE
jgi:hypothetical protein